MASKSSSNMIAITAPEDMPEGFIFRAQYEGKTFPASVPAGGVTQGQIFYVTPPPGDSEALIVSEPLAAPQGRWRYGFCDCCSTSMARFFMAGQCGMCFLGQLLQRYRFGLGGVQDLSAEASSNTCLMWTVIALLYWVSYWVSYFLLLTSDDASVSHFVFFSFYIWMLVAATCLRNRVRKRYGIPGSCCGDNCCDDCCCMYWCMPLNLVQISRQSHHEGAYPYHAFSKTGLPHDMGVDDINGPAEHHDSLTMQPMLKKHAYTATTTTDTDTEVSDMV